MGRRPALLVSLAVGSATAVGMAYGTRHWAYGTALAVSAVVVAASVVATAFVIHVLNRIRYHVAEVRREALRSSWEYPGSGMALLDRDSTHDVYSVYSPLRVANLGARMDGYETEDPETFWRETTAWRSR